MKHRIDDNDVRLLRSGEHYFPALLDAIDAARSRVWLETYIFADDRTGRSVAEALIRAAKRGLDVRVVIDGFGSHTFVGDLAQTMQRGGVALAVFRPETSRWRFRASRLRRMHRKLSVVDERIAFVGGINIIDDFNMHGYANPESFDARFDFAVRIDGAIAERIATTMGEMWDRLVEIEAKTSGSVTRDSLRALERAGQRALNAIRGDKRANQSTSIHRPNLWFVHRDNLHHRRSIEAAYLNGINGAKSEVLIANAYFFPGKKLLATLNAAEARGVRVRLLLQGRREYFLQHYASRALYDSLFNGGIEIAEYHASFLHAKVAVIDGQWATVGSSNIDPFSLLLAREANVFLTHPAFASELQQALEAAWSSASKSVDRSDWNRRTFFTRIKSRVAYRVARLLLTLFGFGSR